MSYLTALRDNQSRLFENGRELKRLIDSKQARIMELEDEIRICQTALTAMRLYTANVSLEISDLQQKEETSHVVL